jgi:gliding motility-associated-like protein
MFRFILTIIIVGSGAIAFGQDWKVEYKPSKAFIENKGQFKSKNTEKIGGIDFAVDYGSTRIFFGKKGVSFDFVEAEKKSREEREEILSREASSVEEHKENEKLFGKFMYSFDQVSFDWVGANPNTEIIGINQFPDYHSYSFEDKSGEQKNVNEIKGFEKIVYKNIYPGIDIEYTIHPENGVKYALYLAPNADPNQVGMKYDKAISLEEGTIHIPTKFGDILDHAPFTFYEGNKTQEIGSKYKLNGRTVSFQLDEYDQSKPIVIDPWVQTPTFNTDWNCIWEVEYDAAGNVYAIGGTMPMKLQKYSPAGALLWTYNTPYDTTSWLGGFGTNDAGESYVTRGSVAGITKVNTAGGVEWTAAGGGTIGQDDEYWTVQFNCDESKVIIGGTALNAFSFSLQPAIFDINVNNGAVLNTQIVHPGSFLPAREVRSLSASPSSRYYWLSHDSIGYINDNFSICNNNPPSTNTINNGMGLGYKCENYRYNNTGVMALRADENFLFVNRGNQIQKRDLQTLAIIATAPIPGGNYTNVFLSGNIVHNSGIDIDDCGNVFVGSINQVVQFDSDLNQINTFSTSFTVYDVHVAPNGRVIAGGSTGTANSNARTGYVQQFNVGSCDPLELICCDASFCQEGPLCEGDAPVTIDVSVSGGTFSGPGVDPNTGVFDPSVAGSGTHTITYTLPCGSESLEFVVNPCATLTVCEEANGDITVTGGVGPYNWASEQTITTPITNQTECEDCGYFWIGVGGFGSCSESNCTSTGWVNYASGSTTNPPPNYPIQITDSQGSTVIINSANDIPPCTTTPCTNLTLNIDAQADVSCNGANDGSATISASGGNGNYTYTWTPGNLNGASQSNLGPGSYTVDVVDTDGCDGQITVEITEPPAITLTTSSTDAACGQNDGSATVNASGGAGGFSYAWSPGGGTNATFNNIGSGNYTVTVTDANGCQETASVTVNSSNGPTLDLVSSEDVSCFGEEDGSGEVEASGGTPGYTYTWNPGGLTGASQNALSAGTYTVSVEDNDGCVTSIQVEINEPDEIVLNTSADPSSCTVDDGSASVTVSGGTGPYTYAWSPGGETTATINNIGAGSYSVTVTDAEGCSATANVNVSSVNGPTVVIDNFTNPSCAGELDGTATATVSGGTSPYSYQWSPSGGNAATATGLGAGTFTVTVTDDAGCITIEEVTLTDPQPIALSGNTTPADCGDNNGSIVVSASGGTGGFTYTWDPNVSTSANASDLAAGNYNVIVTDANGCTASETFTVGQSDSIPTFIVPSSATISQGGSVVLSVETDPTSTIVTYNWSPSDGLSCTDCPNPTASPNETTTYTVVIINEDGCIGEAQVTVVVDEPCGETFLPTIFSPNNDGVNDEFCVLGNCVIGVELVIYNRWGEKVFETNDPTQCWRGNHRGKPVNTGVYAYKARIFLNDGTELGESGNITLVR